MATVQYRLEAGTHRRRSSHQQEGEGWYRQLQLFLKYSKKRPRKTMGCCCSCLETKDATASASETELSTRTEASNHSSLVVSRAMSAPSIDVQDRTKARIFNPLDLRLNRDVLTEFCKLLGIGLRPLAGERCH